MSSTSSAFCNPSALMNRSKNDVFGLAASTCASAIVARLSASKGQGLLTSEETLQSSRAYQLASTFERDELLGELYAKEKLFNFQDHVIAMLYTTTAERNSVLALSQMQSCAMPYVEGWSVQVSALFPSEWMQSLL